MRFLLIPVIALGLLVGPAHAQAPTALTGAIQPCTGGKAAQFTCNDVDLLAFLPITDIGGDPGGVGQAPASLNDIWGWTDPQTGREYALVGRSDGTAFVDVTDPVNPVYLGSLPPGNGRNSPWRDVKAYADHAYIVSEGFGSGLQVFDLTQLRTATPPQTFAETAFYSEFSDAHNIVINEETGFAYVVGASASSGADPARACGGGLHMVDIRTPAQPIFAGCYSQAGTGRRGTGYTHDAQCVVYRGPDADYEGREVCFNANETHVVIADVTDKQNPATISTATYPTAAYIHQGWLTKDQRYWIQDDELDERGNAAITRTRTLIWDVTDLDDPVLFKEYFAPVYTIDHNLYTVGDYVFQANYTSGLRILDVSDIANPKEVAFFDTVPEVDDLSYNGAWSNYPFFASGTVVVSSVGEGLFVLRPTGLNLSVATERAEVPEAFALQPAFPNPFNPRTQLALDVATAQHVRLQAYDLLGRPVALLHDGPLPTGRHTFTFEAAGLPSGLYLLRASGGAQVTTQVVTLAK